MCSYIILVVVVCLLCICYSHTHTHCTLHITHNSPLGVFHGTVDSSRLVNSSLLYHIRYDDGDDEEVRYLRRVPLYYSYVVTSSNDIETLNTRHKLTTTNNNK